MKYFSFIFVLIFLIGCASAPSTNRNNTSDLQLDEHNNVILRKIRNYDRASMDTLKLKLEDVQKLINFIRINNPYFDFNAANKVTDDYRNELLINEFNNNPNYLVLYLNGIKEFAGYSSIYSRLFFDENEQLINYYISVDEEYSDRSGMEYINGRWNRTWHDGTLHLIKMKYVDHDSYYWVILWDEEIDDDEKLIILNGFIRVFRYTKLFENINKTWFKNIFTGIERNQQIGDLVDW